MKLENAIKKLSKHGEVKQNGGSFWAEVNNHVIQFMANGRIEEGRHIICLRVRNKKDHDDSMTDYCAGVWCDNMSQALRIAGAIA